MADRKLGRFLKQFAAPVGRREFREFLKAAKSGLVLQGTLTGAREAMQKLQGLSRSMQKRMIRKGMRKAVMKGVRIAKHAVPLQTKTLRNSLGWRVARSRPGVPKALGIVGPRRKYMRFVDGRKLVPTKYSHLVNDGTAPHAIHGNPRLSFRAKSGRRVVVPSVNHPGAKASYFIRKGQRAARGAMYHVFARTVSTEFALQKLKAKANETDDG